MITATYHIKSDSIKESIKAITIGQSYGNPFVRIKGDHLIAKKFGAFLDKKKKIGSKEYICKINFPESLFSKNSILHFLTILQGGQLDIDIIKQCKLIDVDIPNGFFSNKEFGPKYGVTEIRRFVSAKKRPLIGGILKPKTGFYISEYRDSLKKLLDTGLDFLKEDEILGDIYSANFFRRLDVANDLIEVGRYKTFFSMSLNLNLSEILKSSKELNKSLVNSFHINYWAGFELFHYLSVILKNKAIHYQKSGDKSLSTGKNGLNFSVMCKLARISGADFMHIGMHKGYLNEKIDVLNERIKNLTNGIYYKKTLPAFSCGADDSHVTILSELFGNDILINSGGFINAHPKGADFAVNKMRTAAEKVF